MKAATQRPARAIAWVATSRIVSAALQAVILLLVARNLPQADFGLLTSVLAANLFLAVAVEMGLDTYSMRVLANGEQELAASGSTLQLLASGALAAVLTVGLFVASPWAPVTLALVWLPCYVMVERRLSFRLNMLIALGRPQRGTAPLLLGRASSLVLLFVAVQTSWVPATTAFILTGLAGSMLSVLVLRTGTPLPGVPRLSRQIVKGVLRESLPYWASTMSGQARTLDVPLVALLGGPASAGLYALPARAIAPMRLVGTSVAAVAFPMAAQGHVAALRRLNNRLLLLAIGALLATAAVWQWVPDAIGLVAGPSYADSGSVLRVFMLGVTVNIVGSLISSELQGFGDSKFVAKMGVSLAVVFYAALAIGVWAGGALGAAWGATVAFASQWVVSSWRMHTRGFLR